MTQDVREKNSLLLQKGLMQKQLDQYDKAVITFNRIRPRYLADSLVFTLMYESAFANYMIDDHEKAQFYLFRIRDPLLNKEEIQKKLMLQTLVYHQLGKWDEAAETASQLEGISREEAVALFEKYEAMNHIKLKDPEKADNLSRFLPGVGQMYAGKFWRGLTSSVIQAGLLSFAGYSFLNGFYFSGSLTGVSLFYVFYMGGARHAAYLAEKYNENLLDERISEIEHLLFEGIKKGNP